MLTPDNLLEPRGDLSPELFPGKDAAWIDTLLATYLADAYARIPATIVGTTADLAAAAWSYARAYRHVLSRLSRVPATMAIVNEQSRTITGEQLRTFASLAAKWEAEFQTIIGDAPTADDTPSGSALNAYVF